MGDFDSIIASLRTLAISVAEASTRASGNASLTVDPAQSEELGNESWIDSSLADADAALSRLANEIFSSLLSGSLGHTGVENSLAQPDVPIPNVTPESLVGETPAENIASSVLVSYSSQSTPAGQTVDSPQLLISRPSSVLSTSSRFTTIVPGRTPSPLDVTHVTEIPVPWTRHNVLGGSGLPPSDSTESSVDEPDISTAGGEATVHLETSDPCASSGNAHPLNLASSEETATSNDSVVAAAVHDADPPFLTDGRGRVVWSSASAGSRSRRGRTAINSTAVASSTRDKPQGRDNSQADSPIVRPTSLTNRESETHDM
ncbi:hypothetical protein BDY19DRAFT_640259 [Irpex rosettiformis]|uniref:Uncharacterized protein n=1 Tax=Irpex rosettiformis TaxID=378272 RepID=A0ACB8UBT4_9APHY|nr:hypothetical protein BDY19DRAFT_640259 [Irpex rosettiformis]